MADSMVVGYVVLTYQFERDGRKWVGTCLELSTSTYADTRHKAHEALSSLVIDHLNLLERSGERIRFFDEWNIRLYPTLPDLPEEEKSNPTTPASPGLERAVLPVGAAA